MFNGISTIVHHPNPALKEIVLPHQNTGTIVTTTAINNAPLDLEIQSPEDAKLSVHGA